MLSVTFQPQSIDTSNRMIIRVWSSYLLLLAGSIEIFIKLSSVPCQCSPDCTMCSNCPADVTFPALQAALVSLSLQVSHSTTCQANTGRKHYQYSVWNVWLGCPDVLIHFNNILTYYLQWDGRQREIRFVSPSSHFLGRSTLISCTEFEYEGERPSCWEEPARWLSSVSSFFTLKASIQRHRFS